MFEPIEEASFESKGSDYLKWKTSDEVPIKSHRLRVMGTQKDPATFMQCYQVFDAEKQPHREEYVSKDIPPSDELKSHLQPNPFKPGELEKVQLAWVFTIWHIDYVITDPSTKEPITIKDERPMIWSVHQQTIKDLLMSLAYNKSWSGEDEKGKSKKDLSRFVMQVSKEGEKTDTRYNVVGEPTPTPGPVPQEIVDAMNRAMIDVRVMLLDKSDPRANEGNPFGALTAADDQENIQQVSKKVPIESNGGGINKPVSAMDVLGKLRDNAPPGPDQETAPPMRDGEPY